MRMKAGRQGPAFAQGYGAASACRYAKKLNPNRNWVEKIPQRLRRFNGLKADESPQFLHWL